MAMIHVNRGAASLGAFPEQQVREGIRAGRFLRSDLGWKEGMTNWQPLSQFTEFTGDFATVAPAEAAPPQTPAATPASAATSTSASSGSGLPWERREALGFFNGFVQTVTMILTRPTEAFSVMRPAGGLSDPLLFGVIGGSIGAIVWILVSAAIHSFGWAAAFSQQGSFENLMGASFSGAMLVVRILVTPIFITIGLFIWAGLVHICLMLLGGANKTFETSFRALSYAYGATALFCIIPCCGGLIALIWGLIADCIGISRSHGTDTGRAVIAVLLPIIVCCGGVFVVCVMLGVGVGALMQQSGH
jgi:hypothetical protein